MTKLVAAWLPEGSIELAAMPLKGEREISKLNLEVASLQSIRTRYRFMRLGYSLLATRAVLAKLGPAKTKESWDDFCRLEYDQEPRVISEFTWPVESFETNLAATVEKFLYQNLAATSDDDARVKLGELRDTLQAEMKGIDANTSARMGSIPLVALYWRLRNTGLKSILLPSGPVAIDWDLAKQAAVIDLLAEVVTQEDLEALAAGQAKGAFDMSREFKPLSTADVEGKSENTSTPSMALRPDSEPSSASFTVTANVLE